jgi:DNA-binding transcriptional regulator YiaG
MTSYNRWQDARAAHVERAGGEDAVAAGKDELLATVRGHRLAEIRHTRELSQQEIADRMGVTQRTNLSN